MRVDPSQLVIVKEVGKPAELTYMLRIEPTGIEVSGPQFLRFEDGVKVYQHTTTLNSDLSVIEARYGTAKDKTKLMQEQQILLNLHTPIYPKPEPTPPLGSVVDEIGDDGVVMEDGRNISFADLSEILTVLAHIDTVRATFPANRENAAFVAHAQSTFTEAARLLKR
jgi:hypothetical protein